MSERRPPTGPHPAPPQPRAPGSLTKQTPVTGHVPAYPQSGPPPSQRHPQTAPMPPQGMPMPPQMPPGPMPPQMAPPPQPPMSAANTGSFPAAPPPHPSGQLPRAVITVQYPKVGGTLTSAKGSYYVSDVLGSGEFGAVYEAIGPFDQVYAIKMVRPSNRPYSEVQAEWSRELQRLLSLRHPNVVYIHDAFEQNHLFFLALERCDHALKAMLGTPMQEGLVIELARQLLAAVQFLHDNDVVHDDLHPGNVLITHASDRPVVKISDFGISHELRGMPAIRPNVVHHKIMAPEVLASGYTSKQSDLYQVGLLMYWMLTGEPAIVQDIPYEELVRQVADGAPRAKADAIGTPIGQIIAKMLRRREAYRYTSPREVWADLRELPAWQTRHLFPVK